MDKKITEILKELYKLDPELKNYESEVLVLIEKFLSQKPNTKLDNNFVKKLRAQLVKKSSILIKNKYLPVNNVINQFKIMKNFAYVATGALVALVVIIPVVLNQNQSTKNLALDFGLQIDQIDQQAFGGIQLQEGAGKFGDEALARTQAGVEGYGGGLAAPAPTANLVMAEDGATSKMIWAPRVNYEFSFEGQLPDFEDSMNVLKRKTGDDIAKQTAQILGSIKFSPIDISKFENSKLESVSLLQDKPFGYSIYANLIQGSINIGQNWETWQDPNEIIKPIKITDAPEDSVLIAIADNFVKEYNINMEAYSKPEVNKSYLIAYAQYENPEDFYFPEIMTVLYPLEINGQKVYEQYGEKTGLMINISLRHNKVIGVNNILTQNYTASAYPTVEDQEKLLDQIKKGGYNSYHYTTPDQVITAPLGDPEIAYMKIWNYSNNASEELLVPALVFPVTEQPETKNGYYYKENVIVPLVTTTNNQQDFPVRIMEPFDTSEPEIMQLEAIQN